MKHQILAVLTLLVLLLSSCAPVQPSMPTPEATVESAIAPTQKPTVEATQASSNSASSITVTDLIGRTVTISAPATRIIPTNITALGQMLALGIAPLATFCNPDKTAPAISLKRERNMPIPADTPCISGANWETDWEAVAALHPDLIIGWDKEEANTAEVIAPFFATTTGEGDSFDMYDESLRKLAQLTGREKEADAVLAATRDRAEAYAKLPTKKLTVLHMGTGDGKEFWVFGQPTLNCQLLDQIADCVSPAPNTEFYVTGTTEMILSVNPDAILLVNYFGGDWAFGDSAANETLLAKLATDPLWSELRAVQNKQVYILPHDSRASSVWGISDYLNTITPILYPELFPDGPLTDEQVQKVLGK